MKVGSGEKNFRLVGMPARIEPEKQGYMLIVKAKMG